MRRFPPFVIAAGLATGLTGAADAHKHAPVLNFLREMEHTQRDPCDSILIMRKAGGRWYIGFPGGHEEPVVVHTDEGQAFLKAADHLVWRDEVMYADVARFVGLCG